jgi:hypothetical protein
MPHQKGLQFESCFLQQDSLCPESGHFLLYDKNSLIHRMATHTTQHPPQEMCNEAQGFLQEIVPIINDGINCLPSPTTWIRTLSTMQ